MNPEISAGTLDKRVTLQQPVLNVHQDEIESWQSVTDVWASIVPQTAAEVSDAGRIVARTDVAVVIRWRADIDVRWRIVDAEHTYEIDGIVDVTRRRAQMQLKCKEVS